MDHLSGDPDLEDDDCDRCVAGDDHMIAGPVIQREWWYGCGQAIGDDTDAEENGDREYNGDEGDHSGEPHA